MIDSDALDELVQIYESHWIIENINIGQYRTQFTCCCEAVWIHDGHRMNELSGDTLFFKHVAEWILKVGFRKKDFNDC